MTLKRGVIRRTGDGCSQELEGLETHLARYQGGGGLGSPIVQGVLDRWIDVSKRRILEGWLAHVLHGGPVDAANGCFVPRVQISSLSKEVGFLQGVILLGFGVVFVVGRAFGCSLVEHVAEWSIPTKAVYNSVLSTGHTREGCVGFVRIGCRCLPGRSKKKGEAWRGFLCDESCYEGGR